MAGVSVPGFDISNLTNTPTAVQSAQRPPQQFIQSAGAPGGFGGVFHPNNQPQGQVQATNTQAPQNKPSGGGGGGNNYQQQWNSLGRSGNVPVGWHGEQGQNPQAPDTSVFDQIINPVIQNFESLIGQQQTATGNVITGMNAQRGNEVQQAQNSQTDQTNSLNTQATGQTTAANNAIEDAKRMYSEMSQGDLARYGNTSGTGAFLSEQLGQSTGRNIAQLHQGLQQSLQDINDKITQVKSAGELAIRGINTQFDTQIQTEQDNLQKYITQIRGNEAMLQSNKAQMAAQAIQHYQDTVNNINAQRAQMTQQYSIAALNAQTQLQIYGQKGSAMLSQIQQNAPNYNAIGQQGLTNPTNSTVAPQQTTQDQGSLFNTPQQQNTIQ